MKWYEGGIPGAIQAAKQANSVFIVYIAGEDDKSTEMESCLNSQEVSSLCEENRCVAIKIAGNSNDCKFFSQIYPVVVIPSAFFIGNTGVPLEVIGEVNSQEEFLDKVKKAIEMQKSNSGPPKEPSPESSSPRASTSQEAVAASASPVQEVPESQEEVAGAVGSGDDEIPEKKARTSDDLETRVERAKELVAKKQEEKQQQEADKERQKEIERRAMGQGVQKLRQQQKEMEMLEAKKELKKDREDDKIARQRVKEQIARDRAEKAAKFDKEKADRDQAREEARKKKLLEEQQALYEEQARRSDTARLQFRRPDGSSINQNFPATATFSEVHAFITREMGSQVTLSTTFPRRTFTSEDHSLTLQQLQLVPSAAILVIPSGMSTSGVRGSSGEVGLFRFAGFILAPVYFIWNMLASLLGFGGSTNSQPNPPPRSHANQGGTTATGGDRNPGGAVKRQADSGGSRQVGSIHRFHNSQDDEDPDDNSTWNGNSTQQM